MPNSNLKFAFFISLTCELAIAAPISLSLVESGENKYYEIEINELAQSSSSVIHPDNAHKSDGKQIWAGPSFSELTSKFQKVIKKYPNTFIIGSDTYLAKIPTNDLINEKAIFASKKADKIINEKKGGIHTIFTQSSDKKYHTDSSFWVWSVTGVTLGELLPKMKIENEKNEIRIIDTQKFQKINLEGYTFTYPPGRRNEKEIPKKINIVEGIELNKLIEINDAAKLSITNLFGKIESNKSELNNLVVLTSINGQAISRSLGGPLQICDRTNNKKCIFFADNIKVSKI